MFEHFYIFCSVLFNNKFNNIYFLNKTLLKFKLLLIFSQSIVLLDKMNYLSFSVGCSLVVFWFLGFLCCSLHFSFGLLRLLRFLY